MNSIFTDRHSQPSHPRIQTEQHPPNELVIAGGARGVLGRRVDVAAQILNRLIEAALPANEVSAMKQRGSRYLLMNQTTLLELATVHGKA